MSEKKSEDQDKQSRPNSSSEQKTESDEKKTAGASGEGGKIPDDDYQAIPPGFN